VDAIRNRLAIGFGFVLALPWFGSAASASEPLAKLTSECVASQTLSLGAARVHINYSPAAFKLGAEPLCRWTALAAIAVAGYFDRFPIATVDITLKPADAAGVHGGTTYGDTGGALIVIPLGSNTTQQQLDSDWVMTHEMVHLAVPSVPRNSHWLEEGIATYVEPIARVQVGQLDEQSVWADMIKGMPKGLPKSGDQGLDHTPTWGRTYWGGGLFCLMADVEIRARTQNKKSLRDALRGVLDGGGNIEKDWTVEQVIAAGDHATGTTVLRELHQRMGDAPGPDELDTLWKRLGVSADESGVHFDDRAPLAAVRAGITAREP
jgi:hypothetical protein